MHVREREEPPGKLLKRLTDIDIQDFDYRIQDSASASEEKFDPAVGKKGKGKKGEKKAKSKQP